MIFVTISLPQQKSQSMNLSQYEYRVTAIKSAPSYALEKEVSIEPTKTKALKAAAEVFNDDDVVSVTIRKINAPKNKAV